MTIEGGCMCGNVRYSIEGDAEANILCHCYDCRKISGSAYSCNQLYSGDGFKVTKGTPKQHTQRADSGNDITSNFCGDCGSTMWREGSSFPNKRVVKIGTLDDHSILDNMNPQVELFVPNRPKWVAAIDGAAQKEGMPS